MSVQTLSIEITGDGHLREVETDAALGRWRGGEGSFWIVLNGGTTEEVVQWLGATGFSREHIDALLERGHSAKFLPLDEAVLFEFPAIATEKPESPFLSTFICLDRLVIQIRDRPASDWESRDFTLASRYLTLPERSTSALVCALLVRLSMAVRSVALALRAQARGLSARMDDDPDGVSLDDIVALKRGIRDLDETVDEQLAVFTLLKAVQRPFLNLAPLADQFQVAITNTESSDRAIDRLTRQAADVQGAYDSNQQGRVNRRLGILTIISAIFLPLTLLAGVYGMNFDVMPELHFRFGYPAVLLVMAVTAGGLFWYFRSRRWIDER